MSHSIRVSALVCLLIASMPCVAGATVLLGVNFQGLGSSNASLWDVNALTGSASNARETDRNQLVGVEVGPDGTIYTMRAGYAELYSIDPITGATTLVAATVAGPTEGDLAYDPTSGLIIAGGPGLFSVDPLTGDSEWIGSIPSGTLARDVSGLAVDNAGNLFALDLQNDELLQIDKSNGDILGTSSLNENLASIAGMDFDSDGTLWVASYRVGASGHYLSTLDTLTADLTVVGPLGTGLGGLAVVSPPVPEPSTLAIWSLLGLCGFGMYCRRKAV